MLDPVRSTMRKKGKQARATRNKKSCNIEVFIPHKKFTRKERATSPGEKVASAPFTQWPRRVDLTRKGDRSQLATLKRHRPHERVHPCVFYWTCRRELNTRNSPEAKWRGTVQRTRRDNQGGSRSCSCWGDLSRVLHWKHWHLKGTILTAPWIMGKTGIQRERDWFIPRLWAQYDSCRE